MKKTLTSKFPWRLTVPMFCVFIAAQMMAQTPAGRAEHIKTAKELEGATAQIDTLIAAEYAKQKEASITVGVISGGELVWTKSYGLSDMKGHRPATKDSTYRIGSISKQFAGIMLLQLVEQGKVRLSDPVTNTIQSSAEFQILRATQLLHCYSWQRTRRV